MKVNIFKKINNSLGKKSIIIIAVLVFLGLSLAAPAFAEPSDWPAQVIGGILGIIISAVGLILILAIKTLILVANYSTFLDSGAVTFGWVIVRDLCNMFFVVVLLIIAFGTILNIEKYNYKKWLPKLILMAILINFSKTICGVLIDVAQIVMLTFVNSFSTIGTGTLVDVLGITEILNLSKTSEEVGFWTVVGAYLLGLAYVIISSIVLFTMVAMLAIRIVMIWIYVVLSPLAYLLSAFPGGQSYASKWWSEFTKNLIVGPVLAFFLWLSFAALTADKVRDTTNIDQVAEKDQVELLGFDPKESGALGTNASSPGALIKFVIAIGMLVGGLKIAQEVGGAAGSMAGKGMAAVNKAGKIGLAGAAAITGVRAAKGIYKNYSSARKSAREDKYKNAAVKMADGIGRVKKSVGDTVTGGLQKAKTKVFGGAGADAKRLQAEARVESAEIDEIKQNLSQKQGKVGDYEYDENLKSWRHSKTRRRTSEELVRKNADGIIKTKGDIVNAKQKEAEEKHSKQQKIDDVLKYGALAAGGALGLATGGVPGLLVAGGAMFGASRGYDKFKNAGKTDLDVASNFRLNEIKKEKDALKDEDNGSVMTKMDDRSLRAFERAAAALEAMARGLLTSEQAEDKKKMIANEVGGADENGNFKDKKVGSYFESIAERKNISATNDFQNLNSKNQEIKSRAEKNIRDKVESGTYSLESLDLGAIKAIGPQLVALMKVKDFGTQFTAMKDQAKKREIVELLKKLAANKDAKGLPLGGIERNNAEAAKLGAMKKLNQATDLDTATASISNPVDRQVKKEAILADISFTQLNDVFNGNDKKQQDAIVEAIKESSHADKLSIFVTAEKALKGDSPSAKALRKTLLEA